MNLVALIRRTGYHTRRKICGVGGDEMGPACGGAERREEGSQGAAVWQGHGETPELSLRPTTETAKGTR